MNAGFIRLPANPYTDSEAFPMPAPAGPGAILSTRSLVGADWLRARLGDPGLAVVDVRFRLPDPSWGRAQYLAGHIPGAVFADIERDLSAKPDGSNGRHPLPPVPEAAAVFSRLGIGDATTVIACDDASGMYAARLWWMLRFLGHRRAALLDGGIPAWTEAGGSLQPGAETRPPQTFTPRAAPGMAASAEEVAARLDSGVDLLLDARETTRWRGEAEPIDPVAGRIPGARNHFWQRNLAPDGRFLAPDELARRFAPLAAERRGRRIVCYCGSGLTAAHNALALTAAGFDGVAVYSGSWSEWCADAARPFETGTPIGGPA